MTQTAPYRRADEVPLQLPLDDLIACPVCDALHNLKDVPEGHSARCHRCHRTLIAPKTDAYTRIVVLAATAVILMVAALFFPFLELNAGGFSNRSSIFDAALAVSGGWLTPLAIAVAALIILIPLTRFLALIYALWPLVVGRRPWPRARGAFRLADVLKPWAMAEIFIVGVAVALVKIVELASVSLGPAFWAFAALVLVSALKDNFMCRQSIWISLDRRGPR
ncbi:MAG: paraquat-inducible protein A [Pseudomonadota bacterium]